ncbi:MAG: hypothetical protein AB7V77_04800 [Candidatus Woesearchaeota archaeon]
MNSTKIIPTEEKSIRVEGKVFYNDRRRRIDVKKPIRDLFENGGEVGYIMEFCLSRSKLDSRIDELAKKGITPVIMYFIEGGQEDA